MNPNTTRLNHWRWFPACAGAMMLWAAALTLPATALSAVQVEFPNVQFGLKAATAAAPGIEGRVHRVLTRTERLFGRFSTAVSGAATAWLWILPSAALFLVVAAFASATDLRMLDLRQQNPRVLLRDLGHGVRMFFRILRDRRTPNLPRAVLVLALVYWLLPVDFVGDGTPVVGMLDDLLVTVLAAKLFIHLCPDTVVAAHAAAVRAEV